VHPLLYVATCVCVPVDLRFSPCASAHPSRHSFQRTSSVKTPKMPEFHLSNPGPPLDPALRFRRGSPSLPRPILPYPERQLVRTASTSSLHDVERQKKRPRTNVTVACDRCKLARAKCSGDKPCATCKKRELPCTYDHGNDRRQNRGSYEEVQALTARLANYQHLILTLQNSPTGHAYYLLQCLREVATEEHARPPAESVQSAIISSAVIGAANSADLTSTTTGYTGYDDMSSLIDWVRKDVHASSSALDTSSLPSQPSLGSMPSTLSSLGDELLTSPTESGARRNSSLTVAGLLC
jgi:hypothetical protein